MCVCARLYIVDTFFYCGHYSHSLTRPKVRIRFRFRDHICRGFHVLIWTETWFCRTWCCLMCWGRLRVNVINILASHTALSSSVISVLYVWTRQDTHHTTTLPSPPPLIFAMCACKAGGKQPVKWATPSLDTMGKHHTQSNRWRSYSVLNKQWWQSRK